MALTSAGARISHLILDLRIIRPHASGGQPGNLPILLACTGEFGINRFAEQISFRSASRNREGFKLAALVWCQQDLLAHHTCGFTRRNSCDYAFESRFRFCCCFCHTHTVCV